jgi:hypothetical protein
VTGASIGEGVFIQLTDAEAVKVWAKVTEAKFEKNGSGLKSFLLSRLETPLPSTPLESIVEHFKKNPQDLAMIMSGAKSGLTTIVDVFNRFRKPLP